MKKLTSTEMDIILNKLADTIKDYPVTIPFGPIELVFKWDFIHNRWELQNEIKPVEK